MHDARRPGIDHAEALLAGVLLGQLGGGVLELGPGLGRTGDAGFLEQRLVVVQRVDVDLVGDAVERAADARRRDDAGRPGAP